MLAVMTGLALSAPAVAGVCAAPRDQVALKTRVLQSNLMVAALTCGLRPRYNAFVTDFRSELVTQGHILRSFFRRSFGASGERRMNAFVTRLANEASLRRTRDTAGFCRRAETVFDSFSAQHGAVVKTIATSTRMAYPRGVEGCPQEAHATLPPALSEEAANTAVPPIQP
ncbi:hypothetical protein [Varunaivibrio sulfuroxidans]|uniref:Uncharacterized protein n=1 Tax=Varunaivibrio sulfuroxidans TaxID=1773489 RepID=A0A4R3J7S5_9PROT|nr:hypothetical protein [Varunaivibrio sulfuroxidans]TCS60956.1 hypothetical protein EDD55_109117 [Varunaivibrio sulfuroxidans]WES31638.1 hypothetical protein P3M64_04505 [Varunaivibrio sulfuroxidans]